MPERHRRQHPARAGAAYPILMSYVAVQTNAAIFNGCPIIQTDVVIKNTDTDFYSVNDRASDRVGLMVERRLPRQRDSGRALRLPDIKEIDKSV